MNNAISFFSQVSKDVLARASVSQTRNHRSNHGIRDCINFAPEKTKRLFSCFIFLLQQHQISSTVIYTTFKLWQVLNPTVRFLNVLISLHGNYMSQKYFDNSVFRLIGFIFFSLCIFSSASKIFKASKSIILRRASRNKNIPGPMYQHQWDMGEAHGFGNSSSKLLEFYQWPSAIGQSYQKVAPSIKFVIVGVAPLL